MQTFSRILTCPLILVSIVGCSDSPSEGTSSSTGGTGALDGTPAMDGAGASDGAGNGAADGNSSMGGGSNSTGGETSTGGNSATGGNDASGGDTSTGGDSASGGDTSTGGSSPSPDSPIILDLSTNTSVVHENGTLTVSAIVTDPQGISDVIGGTLKSPSGASYGAFVTSGQEGAYQLILDWSALHAVEPLYAEREGRSRALQAVFFDQSGNQVSRDLVVTLQCEHGTRAACAGTCTRNDSVNICDGGDFCTDMDADLMNCGACGNVCDDVPNGSPYCHDGVCGTSCSPSYTLCGPDDCRDGMFGDTSCGKDCVTCSASQQCQAGSCVASDTVRDPITSAGNPNYTLAPDTTMSIIIQPPVDQYLDVSYHAYVWGCSYTLREIRHSDFYSSIVDFHTGNSLENVGYQGALEGNKTYSYTMYDCDNPVVATFTLTDL